MRQWDLNKTLLKEQYATANDVKALLPESIFEKYKTELSYAMKIELAVDGSILSIYLESETPEVSYSGDHVIRFYKVNCKKIDVANDVSWWKSYYLVKETEEMSNVVRDNRPNGAFTEVYAVGVNSQNSDISYYFLNDGINLRGLTYNESNELQKEVIYTHN